jgi:hypothetical protein
MDWDSEAFFEDIHVTNRPAGYRLPTFYGVLAAEFTAARGVNDSQYVAVAGCGTYPDSINESDSVSGRAG